MENVNTNLEKAETTFTLAQNEVAIKLKAERDRSAGESHRREAPALTGNYRVGELVSAADKPWLNLFFNIGLQPMLALCLATGLAQAQEPTGAKISLQRGARLYARYCEQCHGDRDGKGGNGQGAPHNSDGHTWHHPDAQLKQWILYGKPGRKHNMPGFAGKLAEDEVRDILTLIKGWWTPEQRATQEEISKRYEEAAGR